MRYRLLPAFVLPLGLVLSSTIASAQSLSVGTAAPTRPASGTADPAAIADYVIGPEDHLSIVFFQNRDMSADVVVRPDGKISLPLINDIAVSGLTPEQLREKLAIEGRRFIQEPNPAVVVRQINSRKVFITGAVERPGTYSLNSPTTVLQLIATAAGLREYADRKRIIVIRNRGDRQVAYTFNYEEVIELKNLQQNIALQPGDTVIVR